MPSYTATTDMTFEEAVVAGSMVDGDNLTINNGAVVTCDETPSIIVDQVDINNGILKVDGENISSGNVIWFEGHNLQEINVNGQGILQVRGDWYSIGTTDGTDSQVITFAENPDVIPMVQVETGRKLILDNIDGEYPVKDDWIYKTSDEKVMGRIVSVEAGAGGGSLSDIKSVVFDFADNYGYSSYMGIRAIEFIGLDDEVIELSTSDFTTYATSEYDASGFSADHVFNTSTLKTGDWWDSQWLGGNDEVTNLRLIVVFNTVQDIKGIRINNSHNTGGSTTVGVKATKIYVSTDTITDTVYGNTVTNSTLIFNDDLPEHIGSDVADDQDVEMSMTVSIIVRFLTGTLADNDEVFVRKLVDNAGPDLQTSFTANINNVLGDIKEAGIYQEFGNCVANSASFISGFHQGVGGFVFENQYLSTTLTFGSSAGATGGFKPPAGCDIRVPNVHFMSNTATGSNETQRFELVTTNAGEVDLKVCNVGSAWFGSTNASKYDAEYVGCNVDMGSNNAGSKTTFKNCVRCPDPIGRAYSTRYAFRGLDLIAGTSIIDCLNIISESERCSLGAETTVGVEVKGCICTLRCGAVWGTNSIYCTYFSRCQDVTFENNVLVGSDHAEFDAMLNINATPLFKARSIKLCCTQEGIEQTEEKNAIIFAAFSNNSEIVGIEFIGNGTMGNYLVSITDCINIKIRCMGNVHNKVSFGVDGERLVYLAGICSDIDIARLWADDGIGGTGGNVTVAPVTVKNILVQNCSAKYASEIQLTGNDGILFKGVHGGSGNVSSNTGWEDALAASYGHNIHDCFKSDTLGVLGVVMITPSATVNETTIIAGNPLFYKDGDLDMVDGDVIEFEQSYFMQGHTGFNGNYTAAVGTCTLGNNEWGNIDLAFQYQFKGGAWNGTWLDVRTVSNWTGISGDIAEGIKFKFRFSATGTQTSMSMLLMETTTTLEAQSTNLYPIDQQEVTITLTGLHDDTEVRIYKVEDGIEISGVEYTVGDFVDTIFYPGTDFDVNIIIHNEEYQYIRLENITITENNLTIPIQQVFDTTYLNL